MELCEWYHVRINDSEIHLEVSRPGRVAWQADILWPDIVRVPFKTEGFLQSDNWYIFTSNRPYLGQQYLRCPPNRLRPHANR